MRRKISAGVVAAAAVPALFLGASADAIVPGPNGRIAFESNRGGNNNIYTMKPRRFRGEEPDPGDAWERRLPGVVAEREEDLLHQRPGRGGQPRRLHHERGRQWRHPPDDRPRRGSGHELDLRGRSRHLPQLPAPQTTDACRNGGFRNFVTDGTFNQRFTSQVDCVNFVRRQVP